MLTPRTRLLIPLLVIACYLVHSWIVLIAEGWSPHIQHYIAVLLFIPLVILFFKNLRLLMIWAGIYALLATFNLLTLTPDAERWSMGIHIAAFTIASPSFQSRGFLVLLTYSILNFDGLVNMYLDHKEAKTKK